MVYKKIKVLRWRFVEIFPKAKKSDSLFEFCISGSKIKSGSLLTRIRWLQAHNSKWQNSYDQGGGKTKLFRKAGVTLLLSVVDLYKFCANKNIERIKVFFKSWPHFPSFLASLKKDTQQDA